MHTSVMGFVEFNSDEVHIDGVGCAFCGRHMAPGKVDPVELTITARADRPQDDGMGVQTLWCHAACLERSGITDLHVTDPDYWDDSATKE